MEDRQLNRWRTSIVVAIAMLALVGCRGEEAAAPAAEARTVPVVRAQRGEAVESIMLPGDLIGFYEAALHAKVTGYVKSISVDKGDWVKKGQVLADIEVPELQQNLERARAQLDIARLTYERLDRVRTSDPKLIAKEDVDIARSKFMETKAGEGELEAMVAYTKIVAPFDGVITGRFADPGALIRAGGGDFAISGSGVSVSPGATEGAGGHLTGGGPVLSEAHIDKLRVYVYVPEREAGLIKIGMPVTLKLRSFPGETFPGRVERFATSLDLATRTMLTEIDIENPGHRLYPRMYADVKLDLVRHPDAIEIPRGAVADLGQPGEFVFEVLQGKLVKVPVTTGITNGISVEITSGLKGNELVVRDMSPSLVDGELVHPSEPDAQASAALASHSD
jgi:membrane fusion protein (multidrug efflux system)